MARAPKITTVGHSTRTIDAFLALLREHAIEVLVDVRRYPGSRRNPQFGQAALAVALAGQGIEYRHEPDLGGRRAPRADSPNQAWRNPGFRGYADHMASAEFEDALARVLDLARGREVALMCAEAHPARCHRRLLSDAALVRGFEVLHAIEPDRTERHELHPDAQVGPHARIVYPAKTQTSRAGQGEIEFG